MSQTKSIIVHVICEGQTEEAFVNELLVVPFAQKGIYLVPGLIGRPGHKGGNFQFSRLLPEVKNRLLANDKCYCTTFFDFYGLPETFPGKNAVNPQDTILNKAKGLQSELTLKLSEKLGDNVMRRFIPYVQMYEFEALLFSDPDKMAEGIGRSALAREFTDIVNRFESAEHINNSPQTAPSKRIIALVPGFQKTTDGIISALEIGLDTMREKCPLFNAWLQRIEALA